MLFSIHYEVKPEHRDTVHERVRKMGITAPEGVTIVSNYHSVTQLEGWAIIESNDPAQLWNLFEGWTDLNPNSITPVISTEVMEKLV
ncbi:DUF3303 domain-containing protein [Calycomorphotria hydatis]|uniref:DUF3303 domain-containing protein n=1 Tax=Calycomorphotria hydatis TaxID=2528027 RepID=A0A517T3I2_9PLAN|nr:DUF3303 family protein [Calycomorphotria hydatis]QDT62935.1 hypothetical protein V22_01330 [Calycomorphotria hydatis]